MLTFTVQESPVKAVSGTIFATAIPISLGTTTSGKINATGTANSAWYQISVSGRYSFVLSGSSGSDFALSLVKSSNQQFFDSATESSFYAYPVVLTEAVISDSALKIQVYSNSGTVILILQFIVELEQFLIL